MEEKYVSLIVSALTVSFLGYYSYSVIAQLKSQVKQLENDVEKQKRLRQDERNGRITAQKSNRKDANEDKCMNGFTFRPIGYVESPFPDRRGTPRQPLLVPAATGRIRFDKKLVQHQHFEELSQFSHIWVVFVFHENTNTEKSSKIAKIRPPRLHGAKVGCLSTRSPHRPNEIGLSVCEISKIGSDFIEVKCLDMVHGTPILDSKFDLLLLTYYFANFIFYRLVKPYIPYDVIPSPYSLPMAMTSDNRPLIQTALTVPSWIVDTDISLLPVNFSSSAIQFVDDAIDQKWLKFSKTREDCIEFITQVLRQDVRGVFQGRGEHSQDSNSSDNHEENTANKDRKVNNSSIYQCRLDAMDISFVTKEDEIFVESIEHIEIPKR